MIHFMQIVVPIPSESRFECGPCALDLEVYLHTETLTSLDKYTQTNLNIYTLTYMYPYTRQQSILKCILPVLPQCIFSPFFKNVDNRA